MLGNPRPTTPMPDPPKQCPHERFDNRKYKRADGVLIVVQQCLGCGQNMGARKKESFTLDALQDFDYELQAASVKRGSEAWANYNRQKQVDWWTNYDAFLQSPTWQELRNQVFLRCNWVCEGCGKKKSVHVHHITYAHAFNPFLWELAGVCIDCHQRCHPDRQLGKPTY